MGIAGVLFVEVHKERETRKCNSGSDIVPMEWSKISKPQTIICIGLENYGIPDDKVLTRNTHKELLKDAIEEFELENESLRLMNFMEAVERWAIGNKI